MSFNNKGQKEALAQQKESMALQKQVYNDSSKMFADYRKDYDTRNKAVIGMQGDAQNWLKRYGKGEDVSSLNPAFAKNSQESANQIKATMTAASKLGDRRGGDSDYQAKLQNVAGREIAKYNSQLNEASLMDELNSNRGIAMDTSAFLNQDAQAGLGLQSQLFGMTGQLFNSASQRRQMEIQKAQASMQMLTGLISGGITGAFGAYGSYLGRK